MASPIPCLVLFALVVTQGVNAACNFNPDLDGIWNEYKKDFGKNYRAEEEVTRRQIWESRVIGIIKHNQEYDLGKFTYWKGLNEYADLAHDEFVRQMNGFKGMMTFLSNMTFQLIKDIEILDTVDWRTEGFVTPIKNQKQCGSCWAFSATGSLEGQHKKYTGHLVSLSEQNLVDCSRPEGNEGCDGGLMDQAFIYIMRNEGIDTEKSYPYNAQDGTCHFIRGSIGARIIGFADIPTGDENALKNAVATVGPISVAIDASHESFQLYQGGIYNEPSCDSEVLDHAVLAIGYGTEDGVDYWLAKNSWGTSWGEKGFVKMSRNSNNQCGIATQASYPLVF